MKKRNIPVILLLPLLSLSCSLSHKMERSISKVGLSQAGKRPAPDTTCYSVPEKITWKDSSGVEHIVTMAERDSVTGEEMTVLQLDEVTIVARNRNIPERAGKVNLDFVVTVPGRLIDDKWQVQLTPVAYKRGRRIELERIFLSGADFVKRQKKGYAQYQAFINSIIPDSAYLKEMFDMKGYRRAMAELEEEFYQAWKHDYIAREEWIDWTERWNRRYQHFNAKMERNRMAIAGHNTILSVLPAYWLRRDLDTTLIPSRYRMFSEGTPLKVRRVTPEDSARIAERYFDYKRIAENERKRDAVSRKYEELVRFPYQAARLDTVIRNRNNTFSYYYRQEMDVTDNTKRIDLTVDGRILAVNGKYSINSLVYWVTYVHNVVYSFYRSMIYCYINSTQRCAGSIVIDIIPTNGADKRKFFPFAPYFPVTNVIKRYFYPYFPAIIGIKGYSFPYFPYLSGIMKIKTALYSLFSRLDWHKTVVFPCLGEIYEGIRSLSWEIPVT